MYLVPTQTRRSRRHRDSFLPNLAFSSVRRHTTAPRMAQGESTKISRPRFAQSFRAAISSGARLDYGVPFQKGDKLPELGKIEIGDGPEFDPDLPPMNEVITLSR